MPTVSVKLSDEAKQHLDRVAMQAQISPHAFMVHAIEDAVASSDLRASFVQQALAARGQVLASGRVFDGAMVASYLRAKVAGKKPARPRARQLAGYARREAA